MSSDSGNLPLSGIRVLEFPHAVMGPTTGLLLAAMGAARNPTAPPPGAPPPPLQRLVSRRWRRPAYPGCQTNCGDNSNCKSGQPDQCSRATQDSDRNSRPSRNSHTRA